MTWLDVARAAIVAALGALAVYTGGPVVTWVFAHIDRRLAAASPQGEGILPEQGLVAAKRQLRGGTWVGLLERLAIYAALLAHFPEGIAVALAIKGLARYPELSATTSGAAERFIIGTFVSVLIACAWAGLTMFLTGLL